MLTMMESRYMEPVGSAVTQYQALKAVCGVSKKEKIRLSKERAKISEGLSLVDKVEAIRKWNETLYEAKE